MKSKMRKKLIAFMLCMVLVICNSVSILADTPAPETKTTQQVKETKTVKEEKASEESKTAAKESGTSEQSEEEKAPEVKTTEKKKETTKATTESKKATTEVAEETTTEGKEDKTEATTEAAEETSTTEEKKETSDSSEEDKKENKEATTTEGKEETAPTELTFENDDVIVTVSEVAEGAIPEGAELKVVPILEEDDNTRLQYEEVQKQLQNKALEIESEIKGFLAYDIFFVDENGNEIEPSSEVKVSMKYKQAAIPEEITAEDAQNAEVSVMHLEEDADGNVSQVVDMGEAGKVDTLETTDENKVEKVEVKTESFSAYTLVWTNNNLRVSFNITCIDLNTSKELTISDPIQRYNGEKVEATTLAPKIEGYSFSYAEIDIKDDGTKKFTELRKSKEGENKLQANYDGGFKKTGYYFKSRWEKPDTVKITFYYTDASISTGTQQFYYVYIKPDDDGTGYISELIWSGDRLATSEDIKGLKQNNKDYIKQRFGFGENGENLSYNQNLTVNDKTWDNVEYVGSRIYNSENLDKDEFLNIHEYEAVLEYLKTDAKGYLYRESGNSNYHQLDEENSVVFLFADRLDYTRPDNNKYEDALAAGEITDYSERLKGDDDVSVDVSKDAEWADYYERLAEITFTVNGTPKVEPLDVVLVIDTSYSMDFSNYDWDYRECSPDISGRDYGEYSRYSRFFDSLDAPNKLTGTSRMEDTQNAAFSFITTFMKNNTSDSTTNNRVAIVEFNDRATNVTNGFTENFNDAIEAVEKLSTNSGTNTGEAIEKANDIVINRSDKSRKCVTIVLSDGAPNREDSNFSEQLSSLKENSTVYSIGVDLSDDITIESGKGFPGEGTTTKNFLASIATNSDKAYNVVSGENMVTECFEDIINDLTASATEAKIHDIIGEFFTYNSSGDSAQHIGKNVTIDIGNIGIADNEVSFTVTLDEEKRDLVNGYLTNKNDPQNSKDVYLEYQVEDANNSEPVTEDPMVSVYREAKVRYFYLDEDGIKQPIITNGKQDVVNYIDSAIDSLKGIDEYSSYVRFTSTNAFTVDENILNKYIESYSGVYVDTSLVKISETENDYVLVDDNKQNVIDVVYYSNDQEDPLYIEVQKTFVGIEDPKADVPNFVIELYDSEHNKLKDLRLNPGASDIAPTVSEDGLTFTWKIVGLEAGTYYVKETGEGKEGYTTTIEVKDENQWVSVGSGSEVSVTTQAPDIQFNGFDSKKNVITQCNNTNPIASNTNLIAATLTENAGYFVWTKDTLSAAEREKVVVAIRTNAGHNFNNMTVATTKFFSTVDKIEDGLNFRGGIRIDHSGGKTSLNFNSTDQWSMVCYANYTEVPGINAEIEIKNTYEENKTAIDLIKYGSNYNDTNKKEGAIFELYQGNMDEENQLQWQEEPLTNFENISVLSSGTPELSLPSGYYKLKEIEAPEGYQLLSDEIYFKVETGTVKLVNASGTEISSDSNNMWMLDTESTIITLKIKNNVLYALPSAGGPGIYWYTLSGALLMMGAALIVYKQQRKREVLLKK